MSAEHRLALVLIARIYDSLRQGIEDESVFALVTTRFENELLHHFADEEGVLAGIQVSTTNQHLTTRTINEHHELRALIHGIQSGQLASLREFASLLEAHVEFEERELYPVLLRSAPNP